MDAWTDGDAADGTGRVGTSAFDTRDPGSIDTSTEAFAVRLCNLLRERRRADGARLSAIARRSGGRFSTRELRRVERGRLDVADAAELAALYGADLAAILPSRTPIEVDPDGRVRTAGATEEFTPGDPDAMLTAYLRLIRRLRNAERDPVVELRRDDIVVLADVLDEPGESVTDRLGALMGATRVQRRVMVGLFVAGAVVVGLAVTAVATTSGETVTSPTLDPVDERPALDETPFDEGQPEGPVADLGTDDGGPVPEAGADVAEAPAPETLFIDEPWSASVGTPGGIDVSPIPAPDPTPGPAAPAPAPTPGPAPAPSDEEDPPEVAVGAPPVPGDPAPVVDPAPPEPTPTQPAPTQPPGDPLTDEPPPSGEGVGTDDDGNTVGVGAPPVPEPADPLPSP